MQMTRLVTIVLMLATAPVLAQSQITYELLLGGNNHASDIKANPIVRTAYSGGDSSDAQPYEQGVLNWATTIAVTGNHSQSGHPSDGLATQGVANFVFDLELHSGSAAGPLVSNADFYSTVNDGTGTLPCPPTGREWMIGHVLPSQETFCAGSAYAFSYDIAGLGWGHGRLIEALSVNNYTGPFMEIGLYPTVDADNGRILGTGAGYGQWSRTGGTATKTTKGVGIDAAYPTGLGIVPVIEGQIDTSQLTPGTYALVLVPGAGHNVLRGDVDLVSSDPAAFAVPANNVTGDTITFTIIAGQPPAVTSAVSCKTHGAAGEFCIDVMDRTGNADIEPRMYGTTKLVVGFDMDIQGVGGLDNSDVALSPSGTVDSVTITASNELTVEISGATNAFPLTVTFPGIAKASDAGAICTDSVCVRQLVGDVRPDKSINSIDRVDVRDAIGQTVSGSNFRADVRADGSINSIDRVDVRDAMGWGLAGDCP